MIFLPQFWVAALGALESSGATVHSPEPPVSTLFIATTDLNKAFCHQDHHLDIQQDLNPQTYKSNTLFFFADEAPRDQEPPRRQVSEWINQQASEKTWSRYNLTASNNAIMATVIL